MSTVALVSEWPMDRQWEREFFERRLLGSGIAPSEILWLSLRSSRFSDVRPEHECWSAVAAKLPGHNVVLAFGEKVLQHATGRSGIDKWHASVLSVSGQKVIPCHGPERLAKDFSLQFWIQLCCEKAAAERKFPELRRSEKKFLLNPPLEETLAYLRDVVLHADEVSVDFETGRGQINTIGFAVSPTDAIAINVLPDRLSDDSHFRLWSAIGEVLESEQPKVLQNFIYEYQYCSRYGFRLRNTTHDTMIAQKFLAPELEMGLDVVGRIHTNEPYWKDDGKDWNNIRDWTRHYDYNCKDTAGTLEGKYSQVRELKERGLYDLFQKYVMRLAGPVSEMCIRGIPLSESRLFALRAEVDAVLADVTAELKKQPGAEKLNPRSPAQVKTYLKGKGYVIPKKYDSKTKSYKDSTDEKSLKKLRLKHPKDEALPHLLKFSKYNKAQTSYLNFTYDTDLRMRFTLNMNGTETNRMSGYADPWGHGVNPQTVPGGSKGINIKQIFEAKPGHSFLQVDLKQAESRFVAYDSADLNLIRALEDPDRDIHSEVAVEIIAALNLNLAEERKDPQVWKKRWRQLGKKSGHGANYAMKEATFIDTCMAEMDLVLTKKEATSILEAYHRPFPGIRQWHRSIREELARYRMLKTPMGRERYFYGRFNEDMFREAYAYRPQSTIPDITNHLILFLDEWRDAARVPFGILLQCHDSALLEVPDSAVGEVADACLDTGKWHPKIELPAGRLVIPAGCEQGKIWGDLEEY